MDNIDIDAQVVIDDLLNQIKQLTLQNSILRATVESIKKGLQQSAPVEKTEK